MKILAMFPGQGAQYVGMAKNIFESHHKIAARVFEEASDAIGIDIKKLCFEGSEDQLNLTANTQPCLLTASYMAWLAINEEFDFAPYAFAGHSLGEYSAAVASGKLDFIDAVKLVRRRGEAMQGAVPVGVGAMAAVMNFNQEDLEKLCSELSNSDNLVEIANYNSSKQIVVAGHADAVDRLCVNVDEKGGRTVKLNVSAPFHSSLMSQARREMTPLLEGTTFHQTSQVMIPNICAEAVVDYKANYLIEQIDHSVKWTQTLKLCEAEGVDTYLEVGPGKILMGLGRREVARGSKFLMTDKFQEIEEFFKK